MSLLSEIEVFMSAHTMADTTFGLHAMRDKHFVRQLRDGRDIRQSTAARVRNFMLTYASREAA